MLTTSAVVAASLLIGSPAGAVEPPITGTVTGPGGVPVEGATVRAEVAGCNVASGEVLGSIADEATTAADGTYSLEVSTSCYYVEVVPTGASGLATGWWGGSGSPTFPTRPEWLAWLVLTIGGIDPAPIAIPGMVADVVLGAPVHLSGVVTFEGAPIPGATVRVGARLPIGSTGANAVHQIAAEVVTDATGAWVLDGFGTGTWAIEVVPPTGSDAARTFGSGCTTPPLYLGTLHTSGGEISPWPAIASGCLGGTLVASGASEALDVALVRGAAIEGVVRTSDGAPVPDVAVSVVALECDGVWVTMHRDVAHLLTAADGSYRISGLPPGAQQRLVFTPPDGSGLVAEGGDGWQDLILVSTPCGTFGRQPAVELASGQEIVQSPVLEARCDGAKPFADVADDLPRWGATCGEIAWLADAGITTGYADGSFRPEATLTRGAWITWLWRSEGSPSGPYPDPGFRDVEPGSVFHPAVAWAAATGVANGYADGTFGAARPVTVQAALVMVWRRAGSPTAPSAVLPGTEMLLPWGWNPPATNPFRAPIRWGAASNLVTPDVLVGIIGGIEVEWSRTSCYGTPCWSTWPGNTASRAVATSILHDATARAAS